MRSVLLPTAGDPLLARYWLRNFETWRGEVDALEVYVNGDTSSVPLYEAAGAKIVGATPHRLIHGVALTELVKATTADLVLLIEDDAFVRHASAVGERFERIEDGETDIFACPRGGMSPILEQAAYAKWGEVIGPDTSYGHGLWPCFYFGRTSDLRSVADLRFESISWGSGETIPGIDFPGPAHTDTMTLVAYQLRARFRITPDVQYKEMWQKTFEPGAPWFHAGGLANEPSAARPDIGMDNNEGLDWAHRFWWWRRIGHDYTEHYQRAGLDPDYWTPIIEPWINWDE